MPLDYDLLNAFGGGKGGGSAPPPPPPADTEPEPDQEDSEVAQREGEETSTTAKALIDRGSPTTIVEDELNKKTLLGT